MKLKYRNLIVLESLNLPKVHDLNSLSSSIGLSTTILFLLSKKTDKFYKEVKIPKNLNGSRKLSIPSYSMKMVQKWIKINILDKIPISDCAMAFRKGKAYGIKRNAELHKHSDYILKLDLKDFFHSIKREQVYYFFKNLGYNDFIGNILSNICTYNECLPQGGVASPSLSNIICKNLDSRLEGLASKRDIIYTRYADDITFSCNDEVLLIKTKKIIEIILQHEGFDINNSKTKFMGPNTRKRITGLVIEDNKVVVSRKLKREVRSMIHHAIVEADYSQIDKIKGYISFINSIENDYNYKIKSYIDKLAKKEQYSVFKDIVAEYNKNKIIGSCIDMVELLPYDDIFELGYDDLINDYHIERDYFLSSSETKLLNACTNKDVAIKCKINE
ncbi:retron St85 family RNA-directed DNA polymerase [Paraclostridium bifermentans]|uniref:retron St85 family RNA-directed DNA polymerase n=1 Tax=Paraclostridium bifermentans TaxID=1490 RepID=UPI00374EDE6E